MVEQQSTGEVEAIERRWVCLPLKVQKTTNLKVMIADTKSSSSPTKRKSASKPTSKPAGPNPKA
jgi:hypothetical protein